jgi:hypothetical protein
MIPALSSRAMPKIPASHRFTAKKLHLNRQKFKATNLVVVLRSEVSAYRQPRADIRAEQSMPEADLEPF